jgi:L-ascorbate metabolism protein UlaG (beta-lactamase superfamily)
MFTEIKHYRNSFLDITNAEIRIWMDPWINTAFDGCWAGCNGLRFLKKSLSKRPVDYIYISHLHTDHFDINLLLDVINFQKERIIFIIKKFSDNRLAKILEKNGIHFENIKQLPTYKPYRLSNTSRFIILPQISTSSSSSEDIVNYDLDTSCVFIDSNVKIFNQVDNPYSPKDLSKVLNKLKKNNINNDFDLSFMSYCGSSEYPMSYININRNKEKSFIIKKQLNSFQQRISKIKTKFIIPAGGTYELDSIFSVLNKYLPIPNYNQINSFLKNRYQKKLLDSNKYYFLVKKNHIRVIKNNFREYFKSSFKKNEDKISYNKTIKNYFSKKYIEKLISEIENNLSFEIKKKYNILKTQIVLFIYDKQPLKIKDLSSYTKKVIHRINFKSENKSVTLNIHFFYKAFLAIALRKTSFNTIQQHLLFERKPNQYEPDAQFWLNYYKV